MATSPNKSKSTASSELDKSDLVAKRVRERDAAKKAEKEKKSEAPKTVKPPKTEKLPVPINRGRSDMSIKDQIEDIEMEKKMQKAEEAARDLSGKRPPGFKKGGSVMTPLVEQKKNAERRQKERRALMDIEEKEREERQPSLLSKARKALSGQKPDSIVSEKQLGFKKGGMVTTGRGQGCVMKKRPTRMS